MNGLLAITGAAHGIGRASALLAAAAGESVVLLDRDSEAIATVAEQCLGTGAPAAVPTELDVTDSSAVDACFAALGEAGPGLSGLICAAGLDLGGPSEQLPEEAWERVFGRRPAGTFICCRAAIRRFLAQETPGAIVCVSSPAAVVGLPGGTAAYSAAKGGVSALVRSLAVEYSDRGIRVNGLMPGPTETELMWASVDPEEVPAMRARVSAEVPIGRLATPEEPARAALWLLSDDASYVTGAHLAVDGGVLARASVSV